MNTFLTVGLSVLGTLTTMTGAVAVASKVPAVKDKITISYEDKVVVGTNSQNNTKYEEIIEQLRTENAEKESMITELNSLIQTSTARIEQLEEDNREKLQTISQLETDNQSKVSEIATLNASIEENNQRIAELEQSEEDKSAEILELQEDNQSKSTQIASLNATITSNEETIQELQTVKANNEDTISSLNARITSMGSDITALQQQIEISNNSITELQNKVDSYETVLEKFALVTYVIEGVETTVIQDKGTTANYHEKLPIGYIACWSFDAEGTELVSDDYIVQTNDVLYAVLEKKSETVKLHFDFTEEILDEEGCSVFGSYSASLPGQAIITMQNKDYYLSVSEIGFHFYSFANFKVIIDGNEYAIPNNDLLYAGSNLAFSSFPRIGHNESEDFAFSYNGEVFDISFTNGCKFTVCKNGVRYENAYVSAVDVFLVSEVEDSDFRSNYLSIADGTYGKVTKKIIFYIEDFSYEAEEGMTFEEWVNSDYNQHAKIVNGIIYIDVFNDGTDYYLTQPYPDFKVPVSLTDVIDADLYYSFTKEI